MFFIADRSRKRLTLHISITLASFLTWTVQAADGGATNGSKADLTCFPQVGCFTPGMGPLAHLNLVPEDPQKIQTQFVMFANSAQSEPMNISASSYEDLGQIPDFDINLPFIIVIHGFGDFANGYDGWTAVMKDRLYTNLEATIVLVNWEQGAIQDNYVVAARNSELIGRQVGNFVEEAMKLGVTPNKFYFIGHSLGAHIANFAVYWLRQISSVDSDFTPGRITGLDPAGPYFCDEEYGLDTYLERNDARYVDIYHSNQGKLVYGHVGCEKKLGHADFYPNGGYNQPGCPNPIIGIIEDVFLEGGFASCSHFRSVYIFSESLVAPDDYFWAFPCPRLDDFENDFIVGDCFSCNPLGDDTHSKGCGKVGLDAPNHGQGDFYLMTFGDDPSDDYIPDFRGRMVRISVYSSPTQQGTLTYGQFTVTINDVTQGQLEPFPVTRVDEPIREGDRKSYVFLRNNTFSTDQTFMTTLVDYTAYTEGFVDGKPYWFIDKITVEDDRENRFYACKPLVQLNSGQPEVLILTKTPC